MTADAERIAAEILTLPGPVRAFLAQKLIASLDEETESEREGEWAEEDYLALPCITLRNGEEEYMQVLVAQLFVFYQMHHQA